MFCQLHPLWILVTEGSINANRIGLAFYWKLFTGVGSQMDSVFHITHLLFSMCLMLTWICTDSLCLSVLHLASNRGATQRLKSRLGKIPGWTMPLAEAWCLFYTLPICVNSALTILSKGFRPGSLLGNETYLLVQYLQRQQHLQAGGEWLSAYARSTAWSICL